MTASSSDPTPSRMPRQDDADADMTLIARIAAHDQDAIGELYDRYCRLVFGLALRILPERTEAEAVVEHVFLRGCA